MATFRDLVENEFEKNIIENGTRKIFNNLLKVLNLKKEFTSFAKERGTSEEESLAPFLKKHVFELLRNADKWAKIFETGKEDRKNKKHRKHIINMLPHLKEIGKIFHILSGKAYGNGVSSISNNSLKRALNGNPRKEVISVKKERFLK